MFCGSTSDTWPQDVRAAWQLLAVSIAMACWALVCFWPLRLIGLSWPVCIASYCLANAAMTFVLFRLLGAEEHTVGEAFLLACAGPLVTLLAVLAGVLIGAPWVITSGMVAIVERYAALSDRARSMPDEAFLGMAGVGMILLGLLVQIVTVLAQ